MGVPRAEAELRYVAADGAEVRTTVNDVDSVRLSTARPVRVIRSHAGQRHYPGLFWSATTGGHVPYESRLELDRLWLADFDHDVVWISAQPMWLCGTDGREVRRHVPDFLLTGRDGGLTVVDVKPAEFATKPEVAAVFAWTRVLCSVRGWRYEVWTGGDQLQLANIRALASARRLGLFHHDDETHGLASRFRAWAGEFEVPIDRPLSAGDLVFASEEGEAK